MEDNLRMPLREALEIRQGEIVCVVGAGGKTSTLAHLARECRVSGWRVLLTTTTKILEPRPDSSAGLLLCDDLATAHSELPALFERCSLVTLARRRIDNDRPFSPWLEPGYPADVLQGKLEGVPADWIGPLAKACGVDIVLVEADGAAHKMIKAPNAQEPVLPAETSLVVALADSEALGKPIDDEFTHRPTLLAELAHVPIGYPITPEVVAIALAHAQGGLKNVPVEARFVPMLTTHTCHLTNPLIDRTARLLFLSRRPQRVVTAFLRTSPAALRVIIR